MIPQEVHRWLDFVLNAKIHPNIINKVSDSIDATLYGDVAPVLWSKMRVTFLEAIE